MESVLLETAFCGAAFFGIELSDLATLCRRVRLQNSTGNTQSPKEV